MDFEQCCQWLFNRLPNYQTIGSAAYKPGLENIQSLILYLQPALQKISIVHVAGTNGKGSVCAMTAAACQVNGKKVGLFTSPHFLCFTERIQINGLRVDQQTVVNFVNANRKKIEESKASFFEISFWMALHHFVEQQVDLMVLETGLGGRLDATNAIVRNHFRADLSRITAELTRHD